MDQRKLFTVRLTKQLNSQVNVAFPSRSYNQVLPSNRLHRDCFLLELTCSFCVGLEFFCEGTPPVSNGRLECTHTNFVYTCRAQCNDGFVRREEFRSNHTCGSRGWMPPFPTNFQYTACLREYTQLHYQNTTCSHASIEEISNLEYLIFF